MKLEELLTLILNSSEDDWNDIGCWGYGSGPSYKDKFTFYEIYEGESNILKVDSHSNVLVYKSNISITMAYGLVSNEDFVSPWANQFPDPKASSDFIDIFYNNALVFRETYLVVDGGRCKLPIPSYNSKQELIVSRDYYNFIKLLQRITSGSHSDDNFDYYFGQTGIKVVETKWM